VALEAVWKKNFLLLASFARTISAEKDTMFIGYGGFDKIHRFFIHILKAASKYGLISEWEVRSRDMTTGVISFVRHDGITKNVFYRDGSKCEEMISCDRQDMDAQSKDVLYISSKNIDSVFIDDGDLVKDFVDSVVIPIVVVRR
jgi:hypothetical protein